MSISSGINPQFDLTKFEVDEQRIIRRLAQDWYVTNDGGTIELGATSRYRYFLMKPSERLMHLLNFEREILVLFSPYERFEPRTLDAFDWAYEQYQDLRIERVCRILISKDEAITEK